MAGPFYFAWALSTDNVFGVAHHVEDEKVFALEVMHAEGEFPALTVDIVNPRIGLLNVTRKQWAWLSWDTGTSAGIVPLFFGRLVGIPENLTDEIVRLSFVARPVDWAAQRATLAAALRVSPYWDPIWYNEEARADPDSALEARPALWHTDRLTHEVTISDIIAGEDGVTNLAGMFDRSSLRVGYERVPGRKIEVVGEVNWDQHGAGEVDISAAINKAFADAGTTNPFFITSFTGEGLMRDWPKEGSHIGTGWEFARDTVIERVDGLVNEQGYQTVISGNNRTTQFPIWTLKQRTILAYDAKRQYREIITFTIEADVQAVLTDPGDDEVLQLNLSSSELNNPVDPGSVYSPEGTLPIGDERRRSYFQTDRGLQSIEHLIARARAQLLMRARAVDVSATILWEDAINLSCRQNVQLEDARLPGGEATGKVKQYGFSMDGSSGERSGSIVIGCTVGQGNTVVDLPGDPDYVEDDYVEDGYQTRTDRVVMPIAGEVIYTPPEGVEPNDDGVDFTRMSPDRVIIPGENSEGVFPGLQVVFGQTAQSAVIAAGGADAAAVIAALRDAFTSVRLNLVPLTRGPFETTFTLDVSGLMVPKTIDLEAAAS